MSTVNKNFVVKNGLEVANNLIVANGDTSRIGIATTNPLYSIDLRYGVALSGDVNLKLDQDNSITVFVTGTVSSLAPNVISGINTVNIRLNDAIVTDSKGYIVPNTRITNVGVSSVRLEKNHLKTSGSDTTALTISRLYSTGEVGEVLVSRGEGKSPEWKSEIDPYVEDENIGIFYPTFVSGAGQQRLKISQNRLSFDATSGRLGINTVVPQYALDVIGDSGMSGLLYVSNGSGAPGDLLISNGNDTMFWAKPDDLIAGSAASITAFPTNSTDIFNLIFVENSNLIGEQSVYVDITNSLVYQPSTNRVGIGSTAPSKELDIAGNVGISGTVIAEQYYSTESYSDRFIGGEYFGDGASLVGIVTQIVPSIGINIQETQVPGKGIVTIDAYKPIGKTVYVSQNGDDNNTGLAENHPKRTIKGAAAVALTGDTIKVFPGAYIEENPIVLKRNVAVEGTELRNCIITPKYSNLDLFYVNNSCHITDLSFIGPSMKNGAAVVALQPLQGVSEDRFFDAARMIRLNLDYIAAESVGFLTSGFSGFAGNHREQDAAKLIDLNINFIANETIGFLTSTSYKNPPFIVVNSSGIATAPVNCEDDIKSILGAISYDLKANSNKKSVGAGLSYYSSNGSLLHILGNDPNGYSVRQATVDAINHAVGIVTYVINNQLYPIGFTTLTQNVSYSPILVSGGCTSTISKIRSLSGIVTSIIGIDTNQAPPIQYGVTLESDLCAKDIRDVWRGIIFDITRGGNFKSVQSGKAYFDDNWNLKSSILKNPGEREQTVATIQYSYDIARSIVNNCSWGSYPVGIGKTVTSAVYDNTTGSTLITANNHGLSVDDPVKVTGLTFSCPTSPPNLVYPTGKYGYIFPVTSVVGPNTFQVYVGPSTIPHTYVSGGTIQKYTNFQNKFTQVKDLGIQIDPETGYNNVINSCANVVSAIRSCVGVVTSVIGIGSTAFNSQSNPVGFRTTFPGNSGIGFTTIAEVIDATYEEESGKTTITAPGLQVKTGDIIEVRDLIFECSSGSTNSTQLFPSGYYGYEFYIDKVNSNGSFIVNVGVSTIPHTYVSGGYIVNRSVGVTSAVYDNKTGITTITAPGAYVKVGDDVTLRNLEFSCTSGAGTTTLYPTGNLGFVFKVKEVIGSGTTFVVNTGVSTIPHTYVSGGIVFPPYSKGVGPITQGPYIRNCTNFIADSIGMKVDGFNAEPGDQPDIGVTGTMSVDSYTQYNQGGIGVSITNGAYSQLVSIFTICDDRAIFTSSGGQCDITNSNCSFGNYGLYSDGVGDSGTKSIYRYTGKIVNTAQVETDTVVISGVGTYRPYDGQAIYFGDLYYTVQTIEVTDGGSGYNFPPDVIIGSPEPGGIQAEALSNIDESGRVTSVDIISTGNQYLSAPSVSFSGGGGSGATAFATLEPTYYTIESATLPVAGISTVVLTQNLNNTVGAGTTVYFSRVSLQIATSISLEWVGSGTDINTAKPALGGVTIQENEVVKINGGQVVYTSTNQAGNFQIGDDIVINQLTGTISGRAFSQSLLNTVTPLILGLSK